MFDPEQWALCGRWSWQKICDVAESGLNQREAKSLVIAFGHGAPRIMTAWCEAKVVGTCAMAGWEWGIQVDEHAKAFEQSGGSGEHLAG